MKFLVALFSLSLMRWCPTETMRRRAVLNHWLQHHPVPSWGLVAMSLKKAGLQNLVQLVAAKYVIGQWTECMLLAGSHFQTKVAFLWLVFLLCIKWREEMYLHRV